MSRLDEIRNKLRSQIQDEKNQTIDSLRGPTALNRTNLRAQIQDETDQTIEGLRRSTSIHNSSDIELELQPNKRALFIGNNAYVHLRPLNKCVNDAREMQKLFADIRYRIVYDFDQNLEDMRKIFDRFKEDIQPNDEIVINFSGHGLQINSEAHLCPIDMKFDEDPLKFFDKCINLNQEMDDMFKSGAKMVLAIVDACRNQFRIDYQELVRQAGINASKRGDLDHLLSSKSVSKQIYSNSTGPSGRAIVFATSHDTESYEYPNLNHGIFTHYFLQEARVPGRSISEVIEIVKNKVSSKTDNLQIPAFNNDLNGQFYFQK